ncbi:MAG: phosphoglycerate kinase [Bacilli bacterium]|nr:phosphoglycerate kinase [Bacilli bacterium]
MENIASAKFKNKKVLVRVDYNVPIKDGKIMDETRIVASLKTLNMLIDGGAKVILLSHLGRVKTEEDMKKNSLSIVAKRLSKLVNAPVYFIPKTRGHIVEETVNNLLPGEIALIENTRFEDYPKKLESSCDEALSKYWASLADMFVLDAFGTAHRCHASTYGVSKFIPSYAGYLVEKETEMLDEVLNSKRTLIMGGAKVDDKIGVIDNLIKSSDKLLIGGAMCFTFLKANGIDVGSSLVSENYVDYAKNVLKKYSKKIVLPVDVVCQSGVKDIYKLEKDDVGYDIGPKTIELFKENLENSKMVLWNGPLGKYEEKEYENGTKDILKYLEKQDFKTILAGGDVVAACGYFKTRMYYVSTGGGSTLEYLEGKKFKTLKRLKGEK